MDTHLRSLRYIALGTGILYGFLKKRSNEKKYKIEKMKNEIVKNEKLIKQAKEEYSKMMKSNSNEKYSLINI